MHNWDDLRFFLAVARAGSVTAASEQLGVNQSTVSRRINSFEDQIRVRLFARSVSGYQLTAEGQDLMRRVSRMEEETHAIERQLAGRDNELSGEIRVTTSQVIARYLLLPQLPMFNASYPGIRVIFDISNDLYNLSARDADVAIRATSGDVPETLIGKSTGTIHFGVYGQPELLARWRAGKGELPWIGEDDETLVPEWLPDGKVAPEPVMRSNDVQVTLDLIGQGLGVGRLPDFVAMGYTGIEKLDVPAPLEAKQIWVLRHTDLRKIEKIRVFCRFYEEVIGDRLRPPSLHG